MHRPHIRHTFLLGLVVAAAGLFAGGVVAGHVGVSRSADELDLALRTEALERVTDVPAAQNAAKRSVFVQRAGGFVCLWDAPSATALIRQGGCNLESDPLGGGELFVSFSFDGGPDIAEVTDARLIGLVSRQIERVQIELSDGSRRDVSLTDTKIGAQGYRAFAYRVRRPDLRRELVPVAVVAIDATGKEIERQPAGFTY